MTNFDPMRLLRQDLLDFPPYQASTVAFADMGSVIKLNANENPYGPSPRALGALADVRHWNRYATQDELRPAVARYVGAAPENIVFGNGADEVIDLIERIFLAPGDAILDCPPTFEMYSQYAPLIGARIIQAPRRNDFSLDMQAIERAVEEHKPKLVFIANPNNPDGSLSNRSDIERLLALPAVIVLDEAYAEFSGESIATRVPEQPNLIVLRTFSKWAGLAGLRIGYAVAPVPVVEQVLRTKSPYNVNAAAIVAARASLDDAEYLRANVQKIIAERERLSAALARTGWLQPLPSCTNFILCRVNGREPEEVQSALAARGILIRTFGLPRLKDCIRITVGTPEQDDVVLEALGN